MPVVATRRISVQHEDRVLALVVERRHVEDEHGVSVDVEIRTECLPRSEDFGSRGVGHYDRGYAGPAGYAAPGVQA